ncbi:hypothetical protein [Halorubrum trueperi]|uniref:Uncharacterized protein n=1 Tax=Halorubrum trueperi TaxID=2004704 RepID=A0ABD5UL52_9EURY
MTDENISEKSQTDSQRFGNEKTIEEAFSNQANRSEAELHAALEDTIHLSKQEAFAFVQGYLKSFPRVSKEELAEDMVREQGFESLSEYRQTCRRAREKVADAIWIYELIDAYRFPDFPEECVDCGRSLDGMWVEPDDGPSPLCRICADVDPDRHFPPWDPDDSRQ